MNAKQFLFIFLIVAGLSFAAIPSSITVHGKLTSASNASQTNKLINMTFAIYNVSSGGTALYTKSNVDVATDYAGIYSYELTGITLPFDQDYYLGITVANDTEMTPRINVTSNGYAYRANISDTLVSTGEYVVTTMNATTFNGNLAWSYITGVPGYIVNYTPYIESLNSTKLNVTDQRYNESDRLNSLNSSLSANISSLNISKLQNGSSARLNDLNVTDNLTVYGYLFGQPLLGMMGSGIISSTQTNSLSEVNFTCTGLTCSWNNFIVRLVSGTSDQFAKYCNVSAGNYTVTNGQHDVLYVDNNCNIVETTMETWFNDLILDGGQWDFGNAVAYNGEADEVVNGIGLEQRRMMKMRVVLYHLAHLKVIAGFERTTSPTYPHLTIGSGEYFYLMDIVPTTTWNTTTKGIETWAHNGTSAWQVFNSSGLNYTHCDNGTDIVVCNPTNRWRREFIFVVGYNETTDNTEIHAMLPSRSITYLSAAACLDTVVSPLTYTLPSWYQSSAVMIYAYCVRPTDAVWTTNFIDLRSVGTATASGTIDTSVFVPYSGATTNVNLGTFNLTAANLILTNTLRVDTTGVGTNGAINSFGNINNYYEINNQNTNNGSAASSDIVATSGIGTANSYFVDMGITSATFNDTTWAVNTPNSSFLYAYNTSLYIGTATSGEPLIFFQGGNAWTNEAARFNATGLHVTSNVTALNFFGNINASYVQNPPWLTSTPAYNNWTASQIGALVGNWSGNISLYYLNTEVYNKTEAAALFNNWTASAIGVLVGNWSGNASTINANISSLNISLATKIGTGDIVDLVGNWSNDSGSYYLNTETYNKTESAALFNNWTAAAIGALVGNWSGNESTINANISAINLTFISNDSGLQARIASMNTSFAANISALNLTFILNDSGLQARIASVNSSLTGSYYTNTEVYNKTQVNTLYVNWSASAIGALVGNWSGNISSYYLNTEVYNKTEAAALYNNWSASAIGVLVGNWSGNVSSYYKNTEVYNKTEAAALYNNWSASAIGVLVGNWSGNESTINANISAINLTFISNDSGLQARIAALNTSFAANISAINLTFISNDSGLQARIGSLNTTFAANISSINTTLTPLPQRITDVNASHNLNISAINLTFIANDSGMQARIMSLNTSFAANISAINLTFISNDSGMQARIASLNTSFALNITDLNISKAGKTSANTFTMNQTFNSGVVLNTTATKSACAAAIRGTLWYDQGAAGVADKVYICMKNSSDSYNWVQLGIG